MKRARAPAVVGLALLGVVACGDGGAGGAGSLRVFAASSLTEAFTAMGEQFEAQHGDVDVQFTFAASSALARQLEHGAAADVVATADEETMGTVVETGYASGPQVVARNHLTVLVAEGNPEGITGLGDLARPGVVFVTCAPEVPCGRYAAAALARADVTATPASLEENVKAVVARVTLGEADAGIVYETDARAAAAEADAVPIEFAGEPGIEAVYEIAVTTGAGNPDAAREWVEFVRSAPGQATLARFGFLSA